MSGNPEEVEILDVEARLAAVVRRSVSFAGMGEAQRDARRILDALFEDRPVPGPRLTIWRAPRDGLVDYAQGILLAEPVATSGGASLFTLPAGRAAHLRMRGGYAMLAEAWGTLFGACAARGLRTAGLNWEIYGPATGGSDEAGADLYAYLDG